MLCPEQFYSVLFFLFCCWSIIWRPSVPTCPFKVFVLECLCQQQHRHVPRVDSLEQVGPHTEGASVHLLSYLLIYTTHSLNDPQPEAGVPSRAVTLTNLTLAQHPWLLLCAGQSSLGLCEGSEAAFPKPRAVAVSAEVLWRDCGCRKHELAAAAHRQTDAAVSPAPCSQPFVLVSYQPWHEGVLLVYW